MLTDKITDKITDKLSETIVFSIITRHFRKTERLDGFRPSDWQFRKKPSEFAPKNAKIKEKNVKRIRWKI